MKTTIEIPQTLLDEARKLASQEGTTLRALVAEGLRRGLQILAPRFDSGRGLQNSAPSQHLLNLSERGVRH